MREDVYKRHIENVDNHWWFQARKNIINNSIRKNISKKNAKILDYGAGSGVNILMLSKFGKIYIYEPHKITKKYLKKKFNNKKYNFVNSLKNKKFDLIILADVLEHIKNDYKIIRILSKNLNKNGKILITVPAFQGLFTHKDIVLNHYRRYNISKIKKVFKNFIILKLSYFNFFLFLPLSLSLLILKTFKVKDFIESVEKKPNFIFNKLFFFIFNLESKIINNFNFPFGISILGIFEKR